MNRTALGVMAGLGIATGAGVVAYRNSPVTVRVRGGVLRMPRSTYNRVRKYAKRGDSMGAALQVQKGLASRRIKYAKFPGKGASSLISKLEKKSGASSVPPLNRWLHRVAKDAERRGYQNLFVVAGDPEHPLGGGSVTRTEGSGSSAKLVKKLRRQLARWERRRGMDPGHDWRQLEKQSAFRLRGLRRLTRPRPGGTGKSSHPDRIKQVGDFFRRRPEASIPVTLGTGAVAVHGANQWRRAAEVRRYRRGVAAGQYPGSGVVR